MLNRYLSVTFLGIMLSVGMEIPTVFAGDLTYNPPDVGAPSRRVGAGVRSGHNIDQVTPFIGVLIPKTTGLTLSAQPTLYWTADITAKRPLEIVLQYAKPTSIKERKPLLSIKLDEVNAGLHAIDLKAHKITLKPDVLYQWSVTVVMSDMPSGDAFASGYIQYKTMSADFKQQLAKTPVSEQANLFAKKGIWYDALHALGQQIKQQPDNEALKQTRVNLLKKVTLPAEVIKMVK